jgi:hypothetical protein
MYENYSQRGHMKRFLFLPQPQATSIEQAIFQERLRQARYTFNTALVSSASFAIISITGAIMLMLGTVSEGAVMASTGMVGTMECMRLVKDANDRLDNLMDSK